MTFAQIIGQSATANRLLQMVQQNRLSHALLFLGKEGSGALSLAFAFAQYLVCEKVNGKSKPVENNAPSLFGEPEPATAAVNTEWPADACNVCAACLKAAKLIHPDIHYAYPVIPRKSGDKPLSTDFITDWREFIKDQPYGNLYDWLQYIEAENKQGNITAAECNEIIRKMSLKSFESGYKILIMWMPDMLKKEGNKLLKLIEEPPPDTLFILVSETDDDILPTIISRTQLVKVPPLQPADISMALVEREGQTVQRAAQIAAISEGSYREALKHLQHADDNWETWLREWLNCIVRTGPVAQVKWIDEISKIGREKQKQFLYYCTHLLQQAVEMRYRIPDKESKGDSPSSDFAERMNNLCDLSQQEAIIELLDRSAYHIERNANAKMLFHALTIRMVHIIKNKSVILMN